jgi:hypothetical protein
LTNAKHLASSNVFRALSYACFEIWANRKIHMII